MLEGRGAPVERVDKPPATKIKEERANILNMDEMGEYE